MALDCKDKWRNDMGLFMGRSFRVCFSPDGKVYMPQQCFGGNTSGRVGGAQQVLLFESPKYPAPLSPRPSHLHASSVLDDLSALLPGFPDFQT